MTDQIKTHSSYDTSFLKESFKSFISQTNEFRNYDFDGSGLKEIIRILSFSDQNIAIQNNFLANELNLDSADLYESLQSLSTKQGYTPRSRRASKIVVDVSVRSNVPNPPEEIYLRKSAKFITRNTDNKVIVFSPASEYRASYNTSTQTYTFEGVTLLQGVWTTTSYVVSTAYGIESYKIPSIDVDTSTLIVAVKDNEMSANYNTFTQFKWAHDLGKMSSLYYIACKRDGYFYIEFGDGVLSKRLNYQNIVFIEYLVTDGETGNGLADLTASTPIGGFTDISVDWTSEYSFGGAERESKESIRLNATRNVSSKGNCVTDTDYEAAVVELYPDVQSVRAWGGEKSDPLMYGYTYVSAKFKEFDTMTPAIKTNMFDQLSKRNVGSITPIIIDPDYTFVDLDITLKIRENASLLNSDEVTFNVVNKLKEYSLNQLEFFDSGYDHSAIVAFVREVDKKSIYSVRVTNTFRRLLPVLLNYYGSYATSFKQPIKPGSVVISGFTITDVLSSTSDYSIIDDFNGVIKLIRTNNGTGNQTTLNNNIGSVDYKTGTINILNFNPNLVRRLDGQLEVKVSPSENSVYLESTNNMIYKIGLVGVQPILTKNVADA